MESEQRHGGPPLLCAESTGAPRSRQDGRVGRKAAVSGDGSRCGLASTSGRPAPVTVGATGVEFSLFPSRFEGEPQSIGYRRSRVSSNAGVLRKPGAESDRCYHAARSAPPTPPRTCRQGPCTGRAPRYERDARAADGQARSCPCGLLVDGESAPSMRRASLSIVSANWVTASSAPCSPQPAM